MGYEETDNREQGTGDGGQIARATVIDVPVHQQRSLATVTAEIRTIRAARDKMFLEASVEIGRRLKEAKELVGTAAGAITARQSWTSPSRPPRTTSSYSRPTPRIRSGWMGRR